LLLFLILSYISPLRGYNFTGQKKEAEPLSEIYFNPNTIYSNCNGELYSIPLFISTDKNYVSGTQIEISFKPEFIYNVSLTPSGENLFGDKNSYSVSLQEVRESLGRGSLALELNQNKEEVSGNKKVADVSFQISSISNEAVSVNIIDKSTVFSRASDDSLLNKSSSLTVYCSKTNLPNSLPTSVPGN
jgi:hypothetical protein